MTPDALRSLRKEIRATQGEMADAIGLSRKTVNEMEAGTAPITRTTWLACLHVSEHPEIVEAVRIAAKTRRTTGEGPTITLMADYESEGLWNERGSMIGRSTLPIPPSLDDDIARWCMEFERSEYHLDAPLRTATFDAAAFNVEGARLAARLREVLPGWNVIHRGARDPH